MSIIFSRFNGALLQRYAVVDQSLTPDASLNATLLLGVKYVS
jgi:hypothetical protein